MVQNPAGRRPADRQPRNDPGTGPDWEPVRPARNRRVVAAVVALAMLLTLLGGTAVTIMSAFPAAAHDALVGSDPEDGATLDEPVSTATLEYSAEVIDDGTQVRATTPGGEVDADVTVDGRNVVVDLGEQTAGGEYTLAWRVVSSDGHPIEGEIGWTVAEQPSPTPSAESSEVPSDDASAQVTPVPAASAEASQEAAGELEGLGAENPSASPSPAPEESGSGSISLVYGAALVAIIGVALALLVRSRRRLHEQHASDQDGPGGD